MALNLLPVEGKWCCADKFWGVSVLPLWLHPYVMLVSLWGDVSLYIWDHLKWICLFCSVSEDCNQVTWQTESFSLRLQDKSGHIVNSLNRWDSSSVSYGQSPWKSACVSVHRVVRVCPLPSYTKASINTPRYTHGRTPILCHKVNITLSVQELW